MKSSTKKWLGCALTLLVAVPAFAGEAAQKQLEQEVLTLLKQGKGTQVKTLLENIPHCLGNNEQLYQKEMPARCTHRKFNSAAPNLDENEKDVAVQIKHDKDPEFTKPATIVAVRPANAFVTAMSQYYKQLYKADIKTYNQASYVKFSNHFQDPWLREMARSVLAVKLWDKMLIDHDYIDVEDGIDESEQAGKRLYRELDWRMKLGMSFQQALQAESKIISRGTKGKKYLYDVSHQWPYGYAFSSLFGIGYAKRNLYNGFQEEAAKNNNVTLFEQYKQHIYYSFFATDDFHNNEQINDYIRLILFNFGSKKEFSTGVWCDFEVAWNFVATPMPKKLKDKMRANIGKYIKSACENPQTLKEIGEIYETAALDEGLAWCENFKKQAIKHDLWPMSEAEKQALQRKIQSQVQREVGVQKQQQQKRNKMQIDMLDALQKSF